MADEDGGEVLPVFDPDAMAGPRRATFKPLDPVPIGEDGTPALPPLPPWLSAPAPDPTSAQLADSPPPPSGAAEADEPVVLDAPEPITIDVPESIDDAAGVPFTAVPEHEWTATDPATGAIVRMMDADELGVVVEAALRGDGGTLAALEQFELQLRLRGVVADPMTAAQEPESGSWTLVDEVDAVPTGAIDLSDDAAESLADADAAPAINQPVGTPPELIEPDPLDDRIDLSGLAVFGQLLTQQNPPPTGTFSEAVPESGLDSEPVPDPEPVPPPVVDPTGPADHAERTDLDDRVDLSGFAVALASVPPVPAAEPVPVLPPAAAEATTHPRVVEDGGLALTPEQQRVGRAARMFWLWFPVNASLIVAALGAALMPADGSLRQAILAALIGVALAFIPIGFATMIAKRSGQPTMVASRAVFGHRGNILPSLIALVTRVLLAGALVWFAALGITGALGADAGPTGAVRWLVLAGVLAVVVAAALLGARVIAVVQLVLTILATLALVGFIALTVERLDLAEALQRQDGPWMPVIGGAVLVLSVVGLAWAMSGGDLARYQRSTTGSTGPMLWATFGATLPAFALIAYGAMLAASDPDLGAAMFADPVGAIAGLLPAWAVVPAALAIGGALASGAIIALYSAGLAVLAAGVNAGRPAATAISTVAVVIVAAAFTVGAVDGAMAGFISVLPVVVVPVAAWTGIVAGDAMVRTAPVPIASLLRRGGVIPDVVWGSVAGLVVLTALGWGLVDGAPFTGWLLPLLGDAGTAIAAADLGVLVALVLAIPIGVLVGIRTGGSTDVHKPVQPLAPIPAEAPTTADAQR
jgi:purine-cytosine permease-like protein